jgi:hypothetical protein
MQVLHPSSGVQLVRQPIGGESVHPSAQAFTQQLSEEQPLTQRWP